MVDKWAGKEAPKPASSCFYNIDNIEEVLCHVSCSTYMKNPSSIPYDTNFSNIGYKQIGQDGQCTREVC